MTAPRHRPLRHMTRRDFGRRLAVLGAATWASPMWLAGHRQALAATHGVAVAPAGTTLERSLITTGEGPYFRLTEGPGWPIVVRSDLADPRRGREQRRVPLVSFLHLTDFQFPDVQSPARVEFLDRYADEPTPSFLGSAHRPQEALVIHACEAMNRQANAVGRGPVTGRPLDFTVCTGDNFDNAQLNELQWFLRLMNGGEIAPNSGDPDVFESVQSFTDPLGYDPHYYHPDPVADLRGQDNYKRHFGFPDLPGLLEASAQPFVAAGIDTPWYSLWGNHDVLVQGNAPANPVFEAIATGPLKVLAPPPGLAPGDLWRGLVEQDPGVVSRLGLAPARPVTPDPSRRFITARDYLEYHLASGGRPRGHGFTEDNLDALTLYYTFDIAPQVLGIGLDSTSPQLADGSIGETQLRWLEARLTEAHSRYLDASGTEVRTGNDDRLVVLFSHHRADSMQAMQGADHAGRIEPRHDGATVEALLHRFPNVIAWVNGHSHTNRVAPRPDPLDRTGGFWDITTSAQIDPPQQARILEVVDNRDGTLSLFATVVDHAGPARADADRRDLLALAGISRELAFNDYQSDVDHLLGAPEDLNVELLLPAPFELEAPSPARPTGPPSRDGR
ncbi:MAG: TIGR03767 family metallophosphoesterase [Actinobacteria bacterium]|nr:TIGR03767 family metallophosphoesterase [Actinomycetota bacterium]